MFARLVLSIVIILSGLLMPHPSSSTATTACEDTLGLIGVRGSGEAPGLGEPIGAIVEHFEKRASHIDDFPAIQITALNYPATNVSWATLDDRWWTSVETGTRNLDELLTSLVQQCPSRRYVILGYSQGASVIQRSAGLWDTNVREQVQSVVLIGNPDRQANLSITELLNPASDFGIIPGSLDAHASYPEGLRDRTLSVCRTFDPVCDWSTANDFTFRPHFQYGRGDVRQAITRELTFDQLETSTDNAFPSSIRIRMNLDEAGQHLLPSTHLFHPKWEHVEGALPEGVSLYRRGLVAGTPAEAGTWTSTFRMTATVMGRHIERFVVVHIEVSDPKETLDKATFVYEADLSDRETAALGVSRRGDVLIGEFDGFKSIVKAIRVLSTEPAVTESEEFESLPVYLHPGAAVSADGLVRAFTNYDNDRIIVEQSGRKLEVPVWGGYDPRILLSGSGSLILVYDDLDATGDMHVIEQDLDRQTFSMTSFGIADIWEQYPLFDYPVQVLVSDDDSGFTWVDRQGNAVVFEKSGAEEGNGGWVGAFVGAPAAGFESGAVNAGASTFVAPANQSQLSVWSPGEATPEIVELTFGEPRELDVENMRVASVSDDGARALLHVEDVSGRRLSYLVLLDSGRAQLLFAAEEARVTIASGPLDAFVGVASKANEPSVAQFYFQTVP